MIALLATLAGALVGCLSAIPGLHATALIAGLLPMIGANGLAGSCFVVAAAGSAMVVQALSKTFQPATQETLRSATPEVRMAYAGEGLKAVNMQVINVGAGAVASLFALSLVIGVTAIFPDDLKPVLQAISKIVQIPAMIYFMIITVVHAGQKLATALVITLASLLGFYSMNRVELMGNPASLAPLLSGIFVIPVTLSILGHRGKTKQLPKQNPVTNIPEYANTWIGAFSGMLTAVISGVGASSAVASLAKTTTEEEYLAMQASAEGANNTVALLLLILIGAGHSSTAVAVQEMSGAEIGLVAGAAILLAGGIGVAAGIQFVERYAERYANLITGINPKTMAAAVLLASTAVLLVETGTAGAMVALAAGALGYAARVSMVPNQALLMVLTGPVLIQKLGFAKALGLALGVSF